MSLEQRISRLKLPGKVREALRVFLQRVSDVLPDAQVYLFGSFARGDWLEDSDIDLIVVSSRFKGLDPGKRYAMIRGLLPKDVSVELLAYTPEEFEKAKKRSVIIQDAMEYWVRLL